MKLSLLQLLHPCELDCTCQRVSGLLRCSFESCYKTCPVTRDIPCRETQTHASACPRAVLYMNAADRWATMHKLMGLKACTWYHMQFLCSSKKTKLALEHAWTSAHQITAIRHVRQGQCMSSPIDCFICKFCKSELANATANAVQARYRTHGGNCRLCRPCNYQATT